MKQPTDQQTLQQRWLFPSTLQ